MKHRAYHQFDGQLLRMALLATAVSIAAVVLVLSPMFGLALVSAGVLYIVLCEDLGDLVFIFTLISCSAAMVTLGLIQFRFFPQAAYLLAEGRDPIQMILSFELWGPRYLLAYPAVLLSRWLKWDIDFAFTVYGLFCMTVLVMLIVKYCDRAGFFKNSVGRRLIVHLIVGSFWLALASFMNGRLMNSFLGMTLVLYGQVRAIQQGTFTPGNILIQAVGVFFAMMTSGTAMVAFAQLLVGFFVINRLLPAEQRTPKKVILPLLALSVVGLFPFIYRGVQKNLAFFQGSVLQMLTHGFGQAFFIDQTFTILSVLALFALGLAILALGYHWIRHNFYLFPTLLSVPLSLGMGLFGYSTMLMFLPSLLILGICLVLHTERVALKRVAATKESLLWQRKTSSS